ncbi:Maltose O-acetyltransferase [Nitrospira defluvii]|jgi:maltose O-acetyltransferase|uniref:Maltose O-acetyltransferase n=1 Tax=Nitrospira defluvii TaxID=330214 RepID=D8P9C5_9BACT|nr:Maltose O-acetyltransferase [Nitrospira defluvii]
MRDAMMEKTEKEKMLAGDLYHAADTELLTERRHAQQILVRYNAAPDDGQMLRTDLLRDVLGAVGEGTVVLPTFTCDYGYNISLGRNVFINYHCIFLDCAPIAIGDDVQIGPAVQLYTAQHPLDAKVRRSGLESASPIRIGKDVWIGGGVVVLPGVTIGDRSIVGAGSVVVHHVPPDSLVVGNPARIVRTLV